jgi:hypothetical protein
MTNKIFGYVLLILGIAIIAWTLWQSYFIFIGKASLPLVFITQIPTQASVSNASDVQKQIGDAVKQQMGQILPPETITKTLNLLSWSMLAFILILGGSAISGIGVKLINGTGGK